jgi:hypothetical protein
MLAAFFVEYPYPMATLEYENQSPEYRTDNQSPYNSVDSLDNVDQCFGDIESLIGYRSDDEHRESIESNPTLPSASTNDCLDGNQASKTGMVDLVDGQLDTAIDDFQRYKIDGS